MVRLLGSDIPDGKKVEISLTYIYGVGRFRAKAISSALGFLGKKMSELREEELSQITHFIYSNYEVAGDLRKKISQNIQRLKSIRCYRGKRWGVLPVHGQRSKSNAKTAKGKAGSSFWKKKK